MGCQLHENLEMGCQNVADFLGSLDYLAIYSRVAGLLEIIYFIPAHQKSFILTPPGGVLSEIIYTPVCIYYICIDLMHTIWIHFYFGLPTEDFSMS